LDASGTGGFVGDNLFVAQVASRRVNSNVRLLSYMVKRIALCAGVALITFLLGMFAAKIVRHQPQPTHWQVLLSFQNQDLYNLSDERKLTLQSVIDSVVGAQNIGERPFFPRMFRTMVNTSGQMRYVLVREQPLMEVPGEPRVRTHVFDSDGKLLER
jgi:hypothetical protein